MSTPKHTPGPWVYSKRKNLIQSEEWRHVAIPTNPSSTSFKKEHESEIEANANLIAAAPCMLVALESLLLGRDSLRARLSYEEQLILDAAFAPAIEAIKKAKGE